MSGPSTRTRKLSPVLLAGFSALPVAAALLLVRVELAALPLALFLLLCATAPFLPGAGLFLPVVSRGAGDRRAVALTFDDGPDPVATPLLLDLLSRHQVPATFFVVGDKVEEHPLLVAEIIRRGHSIGNHSYGHDPLLMLRTRATLAAEIACAQQALAPFGIRPVAFRPPVGITNPRLAGVLEELGMECVTFSCRAGDFGNRRIRRLARTILRRVRPGAIILLHDVVPPGGRVDFWLEQVGQIIAGLRSGGYELVSLGELVGRPVMEVTAPGGKD